MKTLSLTIAAVAAITALGGCATAPTRAHPMLDPTATEFTGWVRISDGEFQLFSEQRDLNGLPSPTRCISGVLPRDQQETARQLMGSKVAFTGRALPWADRDGVQTLEHEGARITNQCRGDYVIQAQSVRVLR